MHTKMMALAGTLIGGMALTGCTGMAPSSVANTLTPQTAHLTGSTQNWDVRDFSVERDGILTATLSWIYSNDMDLVLTETSCVTRDFYGCTILASSLTRTQS